MATYMPHDDSLTVYSITYMSSIKIIKYDMLTLIILHKLYYVCPKDNSFRKESLKRKSNYSVI